MSRKKYALNKEYVLNSECALNREGLGLKAGPSTACRIPLLKMQWRSILSSVIQGHDVYKSIWHPIMGEQLTHEKKDGNDDRYAVSIVGLLSTTYRES